MVEENIDKSENVQIEPTNQTHSPRAETKSERVNYNASSDKQGVLENAKRSFFWRRLAAISVDFFILIGLVYLIRAAVTSNVSHPAFSASVIGSVLFFIIWFATQRKGTSIGKWLVSISTERTDVKKESFWKVFLRFAITWLPLVIIVLSFTCDREYDSASMQGLAMLFFRASSVWYIILFLFFLFSQDHDGITDRIFQTITSLRERKPISQFRKYCTGAITVANIVLVFFGISFNHETETYLISGEPFAFASKGEIVSENSVEVHPLVVDMLGKQGGVGTVLIESIFDSNKSQLPLEKRVFQLAISENLPAGAGNMLRSSLWLASVMAAELLDDPLIDRRFIVTVEGNVDGDSAGGLFTVAFLALLQGDKILPGVTMTGTITPDGSIGLVGGVKYKLEAAKKKGFSKVVIPEFMRIEADIYDNKIVDIEQVAESLD
ncbi:MAG: hypothetical protein GX811_01040, partial [Lentisphaerae bacterium]|nr:hypothetical protein [Lentisphaerota bacterium]